MMAKTKLVLNNARTLRNDNRSLKSEVAGLREKEKNDAAVLENLRTLTEKQTEEIAQLRDELLKKNDAIKSLELGKKDLEDAISDYKETFQKRGERIFERYSELLGGLGGQPSQPIGAGGAEGFFDWLETEVEALKQTVRTSGDFCALASVEGLLSFLEGEGCEHIRKMGARKFEFPENLHSAPRSDVVKVLTKRFIRSYWGPYGHEAARRAALDRAGQQQVRCYCLDLSLFD